MYYVHTGESNICIQKIKNKFQEERVRAVNSSYCYQIT